MRTLIAHHDASSPSLTDVAPLEPGPDEVLLDVIAAGVNPIDVFVGSGGAHPVFGLPPQVGLGWDVSGRVAAVGANVSDLRVGDVVAGLHDDLMAPSRSHSEQVLLPAGAVAVVPAGLDEVTAAAVPLNALTARPGAGAAG